MSADKKKKGASGKGGGKAEPPKAAKPEVARERYRIPREGTWANAWKISAVLGALGIAGAAMGWSNDPHRFAFSWLFGIMASLAIALGALFFVIVQHMSAAGWSVTLRRTAEFLAAGLPVIGLLFLPLLTQMDELYPWMHHWRESVAEQHEGAHEPEGHDDAAAGEGEEHGSLGLLGGVARAQEHGGGHGGAEGHGGGHGEGAHHTPEHAAHEAVIESKLAYLNQPFFIGRAISYFLVWLVLTVFFFRRSIAQDSTRDLQLTRSMQSWSPLATITFALTLTFAAFDWMMSLEPAWFSTIFGVQYFAVACVSSLAAIILLLYGLRAAGLMGEAVSVEHFHDMGKLLFGFLVFWAYISFSQFMLIWYASIPEETTYYHLRAQGGWYELSIIGLVCHFFIPFFLLISRNAKRRVEVLVFGAAWLLVLHVAEIFWLVMPYVTPGHLTLHWMDLAALFGVGGAYFTVVLLLMTRYPLIPVGDPRLSRGLDHVVH